MKTLKRKTNNKTPYSKRTRKNKTRFKPRRGDSYYSHFRGYKKEGREMDLRETFICIQYFLIVFACVEMFATKKKSNNNNNSILIAAVTKIQTSFLQRISGPLYQNEVIF